MEDKLKQFFDENFLSPANETTRSFIFNCPCCSGKEKLYIEKSSGEAVCFKQGTPMCPKNRSTAEYALHCLTHIPIKTIRDRLTSKEVVIQSDIADFREIIKEKKDSKVKDLLEAGTLEMHFYPMNVESSREGIYYLMKRGITLDMMVKYDMMYSPVFRRAIFPVIMNQKIYGWQGRAIDNVPKGDRMHNMPGPWKALTLMFYDNIVNRDFAILAEGPISALKFEKVGHFVASMGKGVSQTQLDLLRKAGIKKLYLALDRDADDKIEKIVNSMMRDGLKDRIDCYQIPIPKHRGDFGDCTYEECEQAFKDSQLIGVNPIVPIGVFE